jgi:DNA-binding IclR family transcriptional regulator
MRASGAQGRQARAVLDAVKRWPDSTSAELAALSGMQRHAVARRLPELQDAALVTKAATRVCTQSGRLAVTWRAR